MVITAHLSTNTYQLIVSGKIQLHSTKIMNQLASKPGITNKFTNFERSYGNLQKWYKIKSQFTKKKKSYLSIFLTKEEIAF